MDSSMENVYPIDKGWAWVVLFASSFQQLLLIGTHVCFGILFNEFMDKFNSSATIISLSLSIQTVVLSLFSLFILSVGSRLLSNRVYVMFGGVTGFAAFILNAYLPDITYLILSQGVFFGLTHACAQGPSLVMVGKYFKKYRGMATTLANVGASSGILLFPLIFRAVLETYGLRGALLIQSGILLNFFVAGSLMRPLSFYEKSSRGHHSSLKGERCDKPEQMETLLQEQSVGSTKVGCVENEDLHGKMNKDSCCREINHTSSDHLKENPAEAFKRVYLEPVMRDRTYSDSLRERPVRPNSRLKPEISHSTKSLNRVIDHTPVNGNFVIASSTYDIVGSVYSVCSLSRHPPEVNNRNADFDSDVKNSQNNCTKIFLQIIGFRALKIRVFQIWMFVAFFCILGNAQIAVYIPPLAVEKGVSNSNSVLLLTVMGASDLAGKFVLAIVTRFNLLSKDMMVTISLWILSVAFFCVPLLSEFAYLAVFAGILGSCAGVYFALFPAVLADYVGLTNFSDAMGLTMLVHGFALTIGNPILGAIKDSTGSFVGSFLYTGSNTLIGAIAMTVCYLYQKRQNRHLENRKDVIQQTISQSEN